MNKNNLKYERYINAICCCVMGNICVIYGVLENLWQEASQYDYKKTTL